MVLCGRTIHVTTVKRTTPGPKYALPALTGYDGHDTEATKGRAPAYSLRKRTGIAEKFRSPGPATYLPTAKQTREGNDGTSAFSLGQRHKNLHKRETPGPGTYAPERYGHPQLLKAPEYSMGHRLKGRKDGRLYNPAPNVYTLPSRIGSPHPDLKRAPGYFITPRHHRGGFAWDHAKTPGPAAYPVTQQNLVKLAAPQYTMRPRHQAPGDKTLKPGPGAHRVETCPHTAWSYKKGSPAFSFGVRHNEHSVEPIFADC